MDGTDIPLVVSEGERAVLHMVDAALLVGELRARLGLYFQPGRKVGARLVWISSAGPRPLDPHRPIGDQVPPEAEIEVRAD